jgi:hypothetical protein
VPYNPGVTDISGQLRAQGILSKAEGISSGIKTGVDEFMKLEDERRKAAGALRGYLNNEYFQKEIAKDEGLSIAANKIKSGNIFVFLSVRGDKLMLFFP